MPTLKELVAAYEEAIHARRAGRTVQVAARAGLTIAVAQGIDAVRTLDVVVANTMQDNAATLATWKRERRVNLKATAPGRSDQRKMR